MTERMKMEVERLKQELAKGTHELQQLEQRRAMLLETLSNIRGAILLGEQSLTWDADPPGTTPNGNVPQLAQIAN